MDRAKSKRVSFFVLSIQSIPFMLFSVCLPISKERRDWVVEEVVDTLVELGASKATQDKGGGRVVLCARGLMTEVGDQKAERTMSDLMGNPVRGSFCATNKD